MEKNLDDKWILQMKKGVYELAILLLINKQDMYGYEINKALNNIQSFRLAEGSIYPILKRLVNKNWIVSYAVESEEGPTRKYYKMTEEGLKVAKKRTEEYQALFNTVNQLKGEL
ncbi:PadR family transcriptional regulator [Bacillus sp. JCM 19041]|uniref:PadR family transcriptional regulator n=1 Tax=Bacillus sp. JCM 19041 TaxID=1460637 RepID=UPI0006D03C8A